MIEYKDEKTVTVKPAREVLTAEQMAKAEKKAHQCHRNATFNALYFNAQYVEGYILYSDTLRIPHAVNKLADGTYFCATHEESFEFIPVREFTGAEISAIGRTAGCFFLTIGNTDPYGFRDSDFPEAQTEKGWKRVNGFNFEVMNKPRKYPIAFFRTI